MINVSLCTNIFFMPHLCSCKNVFIPIPASMLLLFYISHCQCIFDMFLSLLVCYCTCYTAYCNIIIEHLAHMLTIFNSSRLFVAYYICLFTHYGSQLYIFILLAFNCFVVSVYLLPVWFCLICFDYFMLLVE